MILKLKKSYLEAKAFFTAAMESFSANRKAGCVPSSIDWNAGLDFEDDFWNPEAAQLKVATAIEPEQLNDSNSDEAKEIQSYPKRFARSNSDHWFSPRGATPYKSTQRFP